MSLESTAEIEEQLQNDHEEEEPDTPTEILEELAVEVHRRSFIQNIYKILKTKNKAKQGEAARKESLKIFQLIQRLLQRKKMNQVRELLKDLMEKEVNTEEMEKEL